MSKTESELLQEQLRTKWVGTKKSDLPTPCLLLDHSKLEHNLKAMQEWVTKAGKKLRPHSKTHKW